MTIEITCECGCTEGTIDPDSGEVVCVDCDEPIREATEAELEELAEHDYELAQDRILEQQELSDFAQDDMQENDYDDSF